MSSDLSGPERRPEVQEAEGESAAEGQHLPTSVFDAVRGLAASYVMLAHARQLLIVAPALAFYGSGLDPSWLGDHLLYFSNVAVLAFFVVSGYAIHYRQARRLAMGEHRIVSWRRYALHRVRRLYPPLCAALALTLILDLIGTRIDPAFYSRSLSTDVIQDPASTVWSSSTQALLGTLAFVQGFATPLFGSDGPLWSLAYEGFFYITYPIVLGLNRLLGPTRTFGAFIAIGMSSAVAIRSGAHLGGLGEDHSFGLAASAGFLSLLAYWPLWVAGTFIADARWGRPRVPEVAWSLAGAAGLVLFAGMAVYMVMQDTLWGDFATSIWWGIALFGLLGWLGARRHRPGVRVPLMRVFSSLFWLGAMSYSLYIVHHPVLDFVSAVWISRYGTLPAGPWLALGGVTLSLLTAFGVYLIAERPFLSRGRRTRIREEEPSSRAAVVLAGVEATP